MIVLPKIKNINQAFSLNAQKVKLQKRQDAFPKILPSEIQVGSNRRIENDCIQNNINSLEYISADSQELTAPSSEEDLSIQIFNDSVIHEELVGYNFVGKISNLYQRLKKNPCMVSLVIDIPFQYQNMLLDFAKQISKISKYVKYLKWNLNSLFTINKYVYVIGEILAQFSNLLKLELKFNSMKSFTRKGLVSLFDGIKKLKKMQIFKFNLEQNEYLAEYDRVLIESIGKILRGQFFSDKLELIKSNIIYLPNYTEIPNLSVYYFNGKYIYNLGYIKQEINNLSQKLVKISFNKYINGTLDIVINQNRQKEVVEFLKQLESFPYLIRIKYVNWITAKSAKQRDYFYMIIKYKNLQYTKLLEIIAYQKTIQQYMTFNPKFATLDFLFS